MASIIRPLAPLPLSGFIKATGKAPVNLVSKPSQSKNAAIPDIIKSIAPDARKIPIATKTATRKGMIFTAILKPSFAPSMKASYTFTFLIIARIMNRIIIEISMKFAVNVDTSDIWSFGSWRNRLPCLPLLL